MSEYIIKELTGQIESLTKLLEKFTTREKYKSLGNHKEYALFNYALFNELDYYPCGKPTDKMLPLPGVELHLLKNGLIGLKFPGGYEETWEYNQRFRQWIFDDRHGEVLETDNLTDWVGRK